MKQNSYDSFIYDTLHYKYLKNSYSKLKVFNKIKQSNNDMLKTAIDNDIGKTKEIDNISGVYTNQQELDQYIGSLFPGSFGIHKTIKLMSPYFSKDDDPIYAVDNPVLKEKVWKYPMIRGSAWKGALLNGAIKELKDILTEPNPSFESFFKTYQQICRIFGTGSDEFRTLERWIHRNAKGMTDDSQIDVLLKYALFELGINLKIRADGSRTFAEQLLEHILNEKKKFTTHRGRAIFYPTYFEKITLEVINPHDFKRRAGTHPIYFEVVPQNATGTFQMIYIPSDGVLLPIDQLQKEAEEDQRLIEKLLVKVGVDGIGGKSKYWGKFNVMEGGDEKNVRRKFN